MLMVAMASGMLTVKSQHLYEAGLLPSININKDLPRDWNLNFELETRQGLNNGGSDLESRWVHNNILTDFTLIAAKKVAPKMSLAGGYLYRIREGRIVQRSIQQWMIRSTYRGLRLTHRLATDQTFIPEESVAFRLRYRIATQFAVSGDQVDDGEWYFKLNHEYLWEYQDRDFDLEIRVVPAIGLRIDDANKLEFGLDYRVDSFIGGSNSDHEIWTMINYYYSF